jgi:hypothetical protein
MYNHDRATPHVVPIKRERKIYLSQLTLSPSWRKTQRQKTTNHRRCPGSSNNKMMALGNQHYLQHPSRRN